MRIKAARFQGDDLIINTTMGVYKVVYTDIIKMYDM